MNAVSKGSRPRGAGYARCLLLLSKEQKTCQRPDVHLIYRLELTAPRQDIEKGGASTASGGICMSATVRQGVSQIENPVISKRDL